MYGKLLRNVKRNILPEEKSDEIFVSNEVIESPKKRLKLNDKTKSQKEVEQSDISTQFSGVFKIRPQELGFLDTWISEVARTNAVFLLTLFKNFPQYIKWNSNGNVSFGGQPYDSRTNIVDLLEYCLRRKSKVNTPPGLTRFFQTCEILHVSPAMFTSPAKEYYQQVYNDPSKLFTETNTTPQRLQSTFSEATSSLKGYEALNIEDEHSSASKNVTLDSTQEEF